MNYEYKILSTIKHIVAMHGTLIVGPTTLPDSKYSSIVCEA